MPAQYVDLARDVNRLNASSEPATGFFLQFLRRVNGWKIGETVRPRVKPLSDALCNPALCHSESPPGAS